MKARFVRDSLLEFERSFDDPDRFKDAIKIGDVVARAKNILKKFSEDNGYDFSIRPNGNVVIKAGGKTFSVTFPKERADTDKPISLRNASGQLMDRFSNGSEVAKRIEGNLGRAKKAVERVTPPQEKLLNAIRGARPEEVKRLLQSGVSPNHSFRSNIKENIPLLVAIVERNPDIVRILVEAGADINKKSKHGETAIGLCMNFDSDNSDFRTFKFLMDSGVDLLMDRNLYWHLSHTPSFFLKYVLDKVPSEELQEQELINLLTGSVWMGQAKKVEMLLNYGVDPYRNSVYGQNHNAFETYDSTEGYMRSQKKQGEYYDYDGVKNILDKYR